MQTRALERIKRWISFALMISAVGILLCYFGFVQSPSVLFKTLGIILLLIGIIGAVVFGYGHRNGKRNVEKMIDVLEKKIKSSQNDKIS